MKINIFLLLAIILLSSFIRQKNEYIFWDSKRPIKYEDFRAVQKDTIKIGNTTRFKGAESWFEYKFNTSQASYTSIPKIEVLVYFDPKYSWMLVKDVRTLEHEQIHFNIAELYARKMRKTIDSLNERNVTDFEIYKSKISDWNIKYNNYNILFDKEIDDKIYYLNGKFLSHKDKGQQKFWKEKVDKELIILKKFEKK